MADLGSERSSEQKVAGEQAGVKLEASQEMACEELRVWIGVQEMGKAWGLSRDVIQRVKLVDETMSMLVLNIWDWLLQTSSRWVAQVREW